MFTPSFREFSLSRFTLLFSDHSWEENNKQQQQQNTPKTPKVEANSFQEKWVKALQEVKHGAGKPVFERRGQSISTETHQGPGTASSLLSSRLVVEEAVPCGRLC